MARSKNSPALFEVIRNAQQKQREQLERQRHQQIMAETHAVSPAAALLRSPLYWFKGKHAHDAAAAVDLPVMREVTEPRPAGVTAKAAPVNSATVFPENRPLFSPDPPAESPAAVAARQVREEMAAGTDDDEVAHPSTGPASTEHLSAQEAPAADPAFGPAFGDAEYDAAYDDDHTAFGPSFAAMPVSALGSGPVAAPAPAVTNWINRLEFNYTTAIIGAFAVIVAGVTLFVVTTGGRGTQTAKLPPVAPTPRPDVLEVRTVSAPVPTKVATVDDDARAAVAAAGESMTLETLGRPIPVPTDVKRIPGHQYLVLLSFPRDEDAKELVKFLAQNGVPATAEKALPDYAKSWTSVVTARGFDHTKKNPAFDAYMATLGDLLQKYAGDSKFRKTFKIDVYSWRGAR